MGFEPTTLTLARLHSTPELHPHPFVAFATCRPAFQLVRAFDVPVHPWSRRSASQGCPKGPLFALRQDSHLHILPLGDRFRPYIRLRVQTFEIGCRTPEPYKLRKILVELSGVEPLASCMRRRRSRN